MFGDGDDDGGAPVGTPAPTEELAGMQELDDEFEPAVAAAADDDADADDDEGRPEDEY